MIYHTVYYTNKKNFHTKMKIEGERKEKIRRSKGCIKNEYHSD